MYVNCLRIVILVSVRSWIWKCSLCEIVCILFLCVCVCWLWSVLCELSGSSRAVCTTSLSSLNFNCVLQWDCQQANATTTYTVQTKTQGWVCLSLSVLTILTDLIDQYLALWNAILLWPYFLELVTHCFTEWKIHTLMYDVLFFCVIFVLCVI